MKKKYYYVLTLVYNDGRLGIYKVIDDFRMPKVSMTEDCTHLRTYVSRDVFERLSLETIDNIEF